MDEDRLEGDVDKLDKIKEPDEEIETRGIQTVGTRRSTQRNLE